MVMDEAKTTTTTTRSALPSFESAFMKTTSQNRSVSLSEPDSDYEYDVHSDCSSNLSPTVVSLVSSDHFFNVSSPGSTCSSPGSSGSSPSWISSSPGSSDDEGLVLFANDKKASASSASSGSSKKTRSRSSRKKSSKILIPCQECEKCFPSRSQLEEHVRYRHSDLRTFQCPKCPKVFKTKSNLNQHIRTHLGKSIQCPVCSRIFTENGLRYHMLTHQPESERRRFSCPQCPDKHFMQNKLLQKHIASCHSEERKYPCPHCSMRFKRKDHLNRHVTDTHSLVERLFECQRCQIRFQSARRLKQHEKVHKRQEAFRCRQCHKTFAKATYRDVHESRTHHHYHHSASWDEADLWLPDLLSLDDLEISQLVDDVLKSDLDTLL